MNVQAIMTFAFVLIWAGFIVRGFVTGEMLARGGDIRKIEHPTLFAASMAFHIFAISMVLLALVF